LSQCDPKIGWLVSACLDLVVAGGLLESTESPEAASRWSVGSASRDRFGQVCTGPGNGTAASGTKTLGAKSNTTRHDGTHGGEA
jgi:hypothetical protein